MAAGVKSAGGRNGPLLQMSNTPESARYKMNPAMTALAVMGAGALAWNVARWALELLGPTIPYRLAKPIASPLDSDEFVQFLSILSNASVCRDTSIDMLRNGAEFYPAELAAIRAARQSVQLEFYEFMEGAVARAFLDALVERARAGVAVHVVLDAIGSFSTRDAFFDELRRAGGRVFWYHPVRFKHIPFIDRRTHRKLIVVDGKIGFIGGAGVGDQWASGSKDAPPWRDTMFRVSGNAVLGMVSTLFENWLECSGEILDLPAQFQPCELAPGAVSMIVASTPQEGATSARVLHQVLLDSATKSIMITTPYFLPDRSVRQAMKRAIGERGVRVQVLTNGCGTDHKSITNLSHSLELELLRAGVEIYEYTPGMLHAKVMIVDGIWSVVGSSNFDHRSFALNNEVNLAVLDRGLAGTLRQQMTEDLARSRAVTVAQLRRRSFATALTDDLSWLIRREE